jgi:hypothetical protein
LDTVNQIVVLKQMRHNNYVSLCGALFIFHAVQVLVGCRCYKYNQGRNCTASSTKCTRVQ